jgi:hypothetical protein
MSLRAILSGAVSKAADLRTSKNGNSFATFSIRESFNGSSRWWQAITFDENAIEVLKEMSIGEPIAVCGEITAEIYAPAGAESRLNWRITVDAILSARRKPKAKAEKATRAPYPKPQTGFAAASSWAARTMMGGDDSEIPF